MSQRFSLPRVMSQYGLRRKDGSVRTDACAVEYARQCREARTFRVGDRVCRGDDTGTVNGGWTAWCDLWCYVSWDHGGSTWVDASRLLHKTSRRP